MRADLWAIPDDWPFVPPLTADRVLDLPRPTDPLLLHLNEVSAGPPESVFDDLMDAGRTLNRYPGACPQTLVDRVGEEAGFAADRIVWGAGAIDLIHRALLIARLAESHVVAPFPNFAGYEHLYAITGVDVTRVALGPGFHTDVAGLLGACRANTALVVVVTPANPTGLVIPELDFVALASSAPSGALMLVDEVYHEFAVDTGAPDLHALLEAHASGPWAILRSFSKAYGLAGARLGYALCSDPGVARRLTEQAPMFALSPLACAAALGTMASPSHMRDIVAGTAHARHCLADRLHRLGLDPIASATNFVSFDAGRPAGPLREALGREGVFCGTWGDPKYPTMLRVSVGTYEEVERFADVLDTILRSRVLPGCRNAAH